MTSTDYSGIVNNSTDCNTSTQLIQSSPAYINKTTIYASVCCQVTTWLLHDKMSPNVTSVWHMIRHVFGEKLLVRFQAVAGTLQPIHCWSAKSCNAPWQLVFSCIFCAGPLHCWWIRLCLHQGLQTPLDFVASAARSSNGNGFPPGPRESTQSLEVGIKWQASPLNSMFSLHVS